ncbi:putative uncharacterized protein FLJ46214 [Myotis yumanensis]|uniref:putative uncharacterized protein FLJ46214 n=1 Tax=Myotis yumanensis TaxID=159337 RepID=UPI0038D3F6FD
MIPRPLRAERARGVLLGREDRGGSSRCEAAGRNVGDAFSLVHDGNPTCTASAFENLDSALVGRPVFTKPRGKAPSGPRVETASPVAAHRAPPLPPGTPDPPPERTRTRRRRPAARSSCPAELTQRHGSPWPAVPSAAPSLTHKSNQTAKRRSQRDLQAPTDQSSTPLPPALPSSAVGTQREAERVGERRFLSHWQEA